MAKKPKAKLESKSAEGAGPAPFSRSVVFARRPSASNPKVTGFLVMDCGHSIEWGGAESATPSRAVCTTCKLAAPGAPRVRRKR